MEATLAVKLGNRYGLAVAAQGAADKVLDGLRPSQWEYFINECLHRDRTVLDKISFESGPFANWCGLLKKYFKPEFHVIDALIKDIINASISNNSASATQKARALRARIGS
jgi:hypothetical protein